MKLPISFPFQKKEEPTYFLSLVLHTQRLQAIVFEDMGGKVRILAETAETISHPTENAPLEELLEVSDKVISRAEQTLPPHSDTLKTIFAIKHSWVIDTHIKREHTLRLKKICESLGLEPIGFIVTSEAIIKLMQEQEGAPVSGILVEIDSVNTTISLVRAGRILEYKQTKLEDSLPETIDRILHHFTRYEVLPSRIILWSGDTVDAFAQACLSHHWSRSLPFLHVPQIATLPKEFLTQSVVAGAAIQMGLALPDSLPVPKAIEPAEDLPTVLDQPKEAEVVEKETKVSTKEQISEGEKEEVEEQLEESESLHDDFGFVVGHDVASALPRREAKQSSEDGDEVASEEEHGEDDEIGEPQTAYPTDEQRVMHQPLRQKKHLPPIVGTMLGYFGVFSSRVGKLLTLLKRMPYPRNRRIAVAAPIILAILLGGLLWYIFGLKAAVVLSIKEKAVEKTTSITFAKDGPTDSDKKVIGSNTVSVSEEGSTDTPATGKKEVGDKAKGTITLLSSLTKEQTITAGTAVTSSNSLVFLTDKDINIASSSGVSDIKSVQVLVTAKNIGKEYNLPSGTIFSVGGFDKSSVQGKNDSAFSGGSKKEVTVVAKADIDTLLAELPKSLEQKAVDDMKKNVSDDKILLPLFSNAFITKKTFSKNVGEEANSVVLQATVTFDGLAYNKDDLTSLAKSLLSEDSVGNMDLPDSSITTDVVDVKVGKDISATVHVNGKLTPKIVEQEIAKTIAGKSFDQAKEELLKLPQVENVVITLRPNLPFLPKSLPRNANNIAVTLASP